MSDQGSGIADPALLNMIHSVIDSLLNRNYNNLTISMKRDALRATLPFSGLVTEGMELWGRPLFVIENQGYRYSAVVETSDMSISYGIDDKLHITRIF